MKQIKRIILSIILPVSLFMVSSCAHEHSITAEYHYDETNHWQECFDCDEQFNLNAHEFSNWKVNESKTLETRECNCGYVETRDYVNPHTTHTFTNYVSNNDASCTKNGTETAVCEGCNKTDTREVENSKLPHSFTNYVENNDATCTTNETKTAKCDHCDEKDTVEISDSKLKHTFEKYVSNNDATCSKLATETGKCKYCDATDTRDVPNSKLAHTYCELIPLVEGNCTTEKVLAHYVCEVCESYFTEEKVETSLDELKQGLQHTYGDWQYNGATFDAEGLKYRVCSCEAREEEILPKLVKVSEIETEDLTIIEGQKVELKVEILTEGAENYRVEWASNNTNVKVVEEEGKYYVIGMALANEATEAKSTITVTVTNVLGTTDYEAVTDTMEVTVVNPIVEYNFDDGKIVNTGTNKDVTERVTTLSGNTSVNSSKQVVYGKDSNDIDNNSIKLEQKKEGGNHFVVNGINLGTNDFTIKTRMNISALITNGNSSCYLFGIGNESDALGNVKDVKEPYFNVSFKLGEDKNRVRFVVNSKVNEKNSNDQILYLPYGEWIDVMVIRNANTLTLVITEVDSGVTQENAITLLSTESVNFTSNCDLAFTGYSGCQNGAPNNYVLYDEIQVYDYALNKEGALIKHTYGAYEEHTSATCTENATLAATCSVCNVKIIKDVPETKLNHDFNNYVTNNDATCISNETETSKCSRCDVTDTREIENTMLEHTYGTLVEASLPTTCEDSGLEAHYQCSECQKYFTSEKVEIDYEDLIIPGGHDYKDWEYSTYPTFDSEGSRTRGCNNCSETFTETLPVLVKVEEIEINNVTTKYIEGKKVELSVDILTEGAENYRVEWTTSDDTVVEIVKEENKFYALTKELLGSVTEDSATLTVKVINVLDTTDYEVVTDTIEFLVVENLSSKIAEFTFDNGLTNSGSNSTIRGTGIDNTNASRYQEIEDMSSYIHTSHKVGNTTYQLGSNALLASHSSSRPSFGIKNIDTKSGDFSISFKYYVTHDFIKQKDSSNKTDTQEAIEKFNDKNHQWYIAGTATSTTTGNKPTAPNFAITLGKDSNEAGFFKSIVTLNGETKDLFVYNTSGYFSGRTWVEFRIVKEGTTVKVSIVPPSSGVAKVSINTVTFNLSSVDDFKITPEQVLGFAHNYGSLRPGNDSYYDDIKVYDYAVDFNSAN